MVQVYDIKVRYMRRMQVKEYEPIEAEVTLSAQVSHGESSSEAGYELMAQARETVKAGILGPKTDNNSVADKIAKALNKKAPAKKTATKKTPAKKTDPVDEIPDDEPKGGGNITNNPEDRVNPEDEVPEDTTSVKKTTKKTPAKKTETVVDDEIPEDEVPEDAEMSAKDLQDFIGASVTSKNIKPRQIKEILAKYNASRIADIPAESRLTVKKAIESVMD